jgi:hypothetical protein
MTFLREWGSARLDVRVGGKAAPIVAGERPIGARLKDFMLRRERSLRPLDGYFEQDFLAARDANDPCVMHLNLDHTEAQPTQGLRDALSQVQGDGSWGSIDGSHVARWRCRREAASSNLTNSLYIY